MWADLQREGKEPSQSNKLTIDVIGDIILLSRRATEPGFAGDIGAIEV